MAAGSIARPGRPTLMVRPGARRTACLKMLVRAPGHGQTASDWGGKDRRAISRRRRGVSANMFREAASGRTRLPCLFISVTALPCFAGEMPDARRPLADPDSEPLTIDALAEEIAIWVEAYVLTNSRKQAAAFIKAAERIAAQKAETDRILELDEGREGRAWRASRRVGRERVLRTTTRLRSKV